MAIMSGSPDPAVLRCDECGKPVSTLTMYSRVVEGGAAVAKGHRECIESEWGPTYPPFDAVIGIAALRAALDAVPDGWAKVDGEWVYLPARTGRCICLPDRTVGGCPVHDPWVSK